MVRTFGQMIGVVGGGADGVEAGINEKLYTSPAGFDMAVAALGAGAAGRGAPD